MKAYRLIPFMIVLASCGSDGDRGIQGLQGDSGQNCYSERVQGGVNVICGDETNFIADGRDGQNGSDGNDGQDGEDGTFQGYLEYRTVCPELKPQDYMETLLYLDGEYMAYLASGNKHRQRLAVLSEGQLYQTTDGRGINFSIVNGEIDCNLNQR